MTKSLCASGRRHSTRLFNKSVEIAVKNPLARGFHAVFMRTSPLCTECGARARKTMRNCEPVLHRRLTRFSTEVWKCPRESALDLSFSQYSCDFLHSAPAAVLV
jgi:hypothetical protein